MLFRSPGVGDDQLDAGLGGGFLDGTDDVLDTGLGAIDDEREAAKGRA